MGKESNSETFSDAFYIKSGKKGKPVDRVLCALIYLITALSGLSGKQEKWEPGKKLKVLLVGYNGARNTGSDVRVAAIARQLKALFGAGKVQLTVMTLDAKALEGYFDEDVELLEFSSFFPLDLLRACSRHHAAILCEGSTLKSTFANALTLFMCEAAGIMAMQGKPCLAYGSEVGKMEPFLERAAARLCRDTYFITRTESSLSALKKLGLRGHVGTDAAWSYDGAVGNAEAEELLRRQGWDGVKPLLGFAVINPFCWPVRASLNKWFKGKLTGKLEGQYDKWYFFSDSPKRREAYEAYIQSVAAAANAFIKENDAFPVLIGMERLDEKPCKELSAQLNRASAMFLSGEYGAPVMTGILRRLDMLVTSRYHAAVLSMKGGCPIVALSMDERLDGILHELELDGRYLLHTGDEGLAEKLSSAMKSAQIERDGIREKIQAALPGYQKKLNDMGIFMREYIQTALRMS